MAESILSLLSESLWALHIIAAVGLLAAVFFSYKLYRETDRGWYWVSLVLSAVFLALAHWSSLLFPLSLVDFELLALMQEAGEIISGLLFAVACWGMYRTMRHIRKRVE